MISTSAKSVRSTPAPTTWQQLLKDAVRDPFELCRLLNLPRQLAEAAQRASNDFSLFAPRGFIARMRPADAADPLLRQVLPVATELETADGFTLDPVGDQAAQRSPGLLSKYHGRALMVTTGACAVHCRYCFRRHFPYTQAPHRPEDWQPALAEIEADPTMAEVILSGGDPLMLVDSQLADLSARIAKIGHVQRLRVHTRLPIMIPERVTTELIAWLRGSRLTTLMVLHVNHAAELDDHVAGAVAQLADAGIPLLNQAVLLRGVNDSVAALAELSRRLVELRIMPYYLHQLDRVVGAAHFEVPTHRGRELLAELRRELPGYAVPRYVCEVPGAAHKLEL